MDRPERDGGERSQKSPTSVGSKRALQFATARAIFNTDERIIPGTDRSRSTTAGWLRGDKIAYKTPFPLGPFTFMITKGPQGPKLAAPVWMEMTGPVSHWHPTDIIEKTPTSDMGPFTVVSAATPSIIINRSWVCIGILREDALIPLFPEFLSMVRVTTMPFDESPRYNLQWAKELTIVKFDKGDMICQVTGEYGGGFLAEFDPDEILENYSELDGPSSEYTDSDGEHQSKAERRQQILDDNQIWLVTETVHMDLLQNQTQNVELTVDTLYHLEAYWDNPDSDDDGYGERKAKVDYAKVEFTKSPVAGGRVRCTVIFKVPFGEVGTYLPDRDIPDEFLSSLCGPAVSLDDAVSLRKPCAFNIPEKTYLERGARLPNGDFEMYARTGWIAADMTSVCYAHSLLMHVLTGPDRRRYDTTQPDDGSPMKETLVPSSLYELRQFGDSGCLQLALRSGLGTDFVSGGAALRFFFESLVSRAAKVVHREIMGLGTDPATGVYQQQRLVVAMVTRPWLATVLQVIADTAERTEKHEYLGCHVCASPDRQAAWTVTGTGGIQVCSDSCYAMLKEACK